MGPVETMCKWNCMFALTLLIVSGNAQASLQKDLNLVVDGVQRHYDLYVPDNGRVTKSPLVIMYHGHVGNPDVMTGENGKRAPYKVWLQLAEQEGFLVAVPEGEKGSDDKRGWNDCRADATTNPTTDDVKFTLQMIDAIDQQYSLDRSRLYATGTSNGGNMVIRLALEVPETFAGVAAIVASNPVKSECREKRQPIPVLFMNGTADPFLPYHGGKVGKDKHSRGTALATPAAVAYWTEVNATDRQPTYHVFPDLAPEEDSQVIRYTYAHGRDGTEVVLYEVINGGHTEPSRQERYRRLYEWIVGNQNHDIEMANEVWQFFKTKRRSRGDIK